MNNGNTSLGSDSMINFSEIVNTWKNSDRPTTKKDAPIWKIAPEGQNYAEPGTLISVGEGVMIGRDFKIGEYSRLGDRCSFGKSVTLSEGVIIGKRVKVGEGSLIRERSTILHRTRIHSGVDIGSYVYIGSDCLLQHAVVVGQGSSIYDGTIVHRECIIEKEVWIGRNTILHSGVVIGPDCSIGEHCSIDPGTYLGKGVTMGEDAKSPVYLGHTDGYSKIVAEVNGVAYIGAGCRWFPLAEALHHWKNRTEDRALTLCLMEAAIAVAKLRGWNYQDKVIPKKRTRKKKSVE